jgi:hypothetical protein
MRRDQGQCPLVEIEFGSSLKILDCWFRFLSSHHTPQAPGPVGTDRLSPPADWSQTATEESPARGKANRSRALEHNYDSYQGSAHPVNRPDRTMSLAADCMPPDQGLVYQVGRKYSDARYQIQHLEQDYSSLCYKDPDQVRQMIPGRPATYTLSAGITYRVAGTRAEVLSGNDRAFGFERRRE